jgi:DNA-binding response OmpR family regulator
MSKRILMIEDDREMVTLGKLILEREGYEVLTAYDGAQGLELLQQENGNVDLLLLDIMMTGMDGWQVLTKVKAD